MRSCHTPRNFSNITGVILKIIGWNPKNHWNYQWYSIFSGVKKVIQFCRGGKKSKHFFSGKWFYRTGFHRYGFSWGTETGCIWNNCINHFSSIENGKVVLLSLCLTWTLWRWTLVVAVISFDAYLFLASSEMICHLEEKGISVFWLHCATW